MKLHAGSLQPTKHIHCIRVLHLHRLVVQGALTESLLEDTGGVEKFVGYDCVKHAHASLIKNTDEGFATLKVFGDCLGKRFDSTWNSNVCDWYHMACVVVNFPRVEPRLKMMTKTWSRKIIGPKSRIGNSRFCQRTIEIEHANEPWPLSRPVGKRENRAGVSG